MMNSTCLKSIEFTEGQRRCLVEDKRADEIKSKVETWIQGDYGMIGIIPPSKGTTQQDWDNFYKTIAEIAVKNSIVKVKEEAD